MAPIQKALVAQWCKNPEHRVEVDPSFHPWLCGFNPSSSDSAFQKRPLRLFFYFIFWNENMTELLSSLTRKTIPWINRISYWIYFFFRGKIRCMATIFTVLLITFLIIIITTTTRCSIINSMAIITWGAAVEEVRWKWAPWWAEEESITAVAFRITSQSVRCNIRINNSNNTIHPTLSSNFSTRMRTVCNTTVTVRESKRINCAIEFQFAINYVDGKTKQNNIMNGWLVQSVSLSDSGGTPVFLFIMTGIPPYLFTSWKKKDKILKKQKPNNFFFLKNVLYCFIHRRFE